MLDKPVVYDVVKTELEKKIAQIQFSFDDLQSALSSNTKSSAGDKHETGRAMAQLEQEKLSGQLNNLITLRNALSLIDLQEKHDTIRHGSLVKTNQGIFFFSIGLGKIEVGKKSVFCLTPTTPLGQLLIGKKQGDTFDFNGNSDLIMEVV